MKGINQRTTPSSNQLINRWLINSIRNPRSFPCALLVLFPLLAASGTRGLMSCTRAPPRTTRVDKMVDARGRGRRLLREIIECRLPLQPPSTRCCCPFDLIDNNTFDRTRWGNVKKMLFLSLSYLSLLEMLSLKFFAWVHLQRFSW